MCKTMLNLSVTSSFPCEISVTSPSEGRTRVSAAWNGEAAGEKLILSWTLPIIDMQYWWYPSCGFNRSLRVDWNAPIKTKISVSAPVFAFYNAAGVNRFTCALDDVKTEIASSLGVREEDGKLSCKIEIPLHENTREYVITLYTDFDEVSLAESLRRVSAWWEKECGMVPMRVPDSAREPMYSFWYSYHQATIASDIEKECALAKRHGFNTVIVDDGWQTDDGNRGYAFCGDWEPAASKIPDMRAHVARVHALGMKYILWYSVPYVGIHSKQFERFKGKFLTSHEKLGAFTLDPRYPDVRRYLIDTYTKALTDWDLDGFKLDFIDSFHPRNDPLPPYDPEMDIANVERAVERLMTDVMNALRAIKPDIMIEFRQSYIGPVMRTYGNMFRVGDCPDDAITNRVGIIDLRLLSGNTAVHSDMLMWHKNDTPESAALQLTGTVFGVPQISVKLGEMSAAHSEVLTFWTDFMRENRDVLLDAPLEVTEAQNLYPEVRAKKNGREIIALYSAGRLVTLSEAADTVIANGTFGNTFILEGNGDYAFEARDCRGRVTEKGNISARGTVKVSIPVCGLIKLTRI